jgi:pSer/pThr/pTyr-binding forkhead associated (FHA) protein
MAAKLIGRTGAVAGKDYAVTEMVRIGAAREADVRVRAEGVSRIHARVWREGDDYWLEDVGSTNGTFLSGIRIRKDRLRHLDVVTLGRSVDLIFVVGHDEATAAAPAPAASRGIISATLDPVDGPDAGTPIEIPKGEITFGRADSNNVVVDNRAISKIHARIERTSDVVRLQDLGSVNGTFVNDTRIDTPIVLGRGDNISLAGVRAFRVTIDRDDEADDSISSTPQSQIGPLFSQEWKTRLVWSAEELAQLAELSESPPEAPPEPKQSTSKKPVSKHVAVEAGAAAKKAPAVSPPQAVVPPPPAKVESKPEPTSAPAPAVSPPQAVVPPPPPPPAKVAPKPEPPPAPAPAVSPPQAVVPPPPPPPAKVAPKPEPPPTPAPAVLPPQAVVPPPPPPPAKVESKPEPPPAPARTALRPKQAVPPSTRQAEEAPTVLAAGPPVTPRQVRLVGATTHTLEPGSTTVGRGTTATLRVDDKKASRTHAEIIVTPDEATIEDKGSVNGTVVNDREISTRQRLVNGDRVKIGETEWTVEIS